MKKIFTLLLITTMVSCGYAPIDNSQYVIITQIQKYDDKFSDYYGGGNSNMSITLTGFNFKFRDTTGKFQIGDTINFVKQ